MINHSVATIEEKFVETAELNEDERAFKSEKPSSCSHCEKRFVEAAELNQHEQANTSDKPYSCSNCEEIFTQSVELSKHEEPTRVYLILNFRNTLYIYLTVQ